MWQTRARVRSPKILQLWQLLCSGVIIIILYHVQWARVASFKLSACLPTNQHRTNKQTHSRRMASFNGSLDFTFYYFLHLSAHKCCTILCATNGARFISFSLRKRKKNTRRIDAACIRHSHQKIHTLKVFVSLL